VNLLNIEGVEISYFNYAKRIGGFFMPLNERPLTVLDLTFCIEGEMHYIYNGDHIILHPDDGILMLPGSFRERYESDIPIRYASINLIFENEQVFDFDGYLPKVVNSDILFMLDLMKKDFATVSPCRKQKGLSSFSYIYNHIFDNLCNVENSHIRALKQYIADNLCNNITLSELANHVHLAPQYISLLFKKETGLTITQFILNRRIDKAKMMIITTNDPVQVIAEKSGFTDYCYFSHAFKKVTGISPRQFRSDNSKKSELRQGFFQ